MGRCDESDPDVRGSRSGTQWFSPGPGGGGVEQHQPLQPDREPDREEVRQLPPLRLMVEMDGRNHPEEYLLSLSEMEQVKQEEAVPIVDPPQDPTE